MNPIVEHSETRTITHPEGDSSLTLDILIDIRKSDIRAKLMSVFDDAVGDGGNFEVFLRISHITKEGMTTVQGDLKVWIT